MRELDKSQENQPQQAGYEIIKENIRTAEGRLYLWDEILRDFVSPVEIKGLREGYVSLKEYAKHDRLVKEFRKQVNKIGEILRALGDKSSVSNVEVMNVHTRVAIIENLQSIILEPLDDDSETDSFGGKKEVDKISKVKAVANNSTDIFEQLSDEEQARITQNKTDASAADRYEVEQKTYIDYIDEENEAFEQGRKKISHTVVKNKGKDNEKSKTFDKWVNIHPSESRKEPSVDKGTSSSLAEQLHQKLETINNDSVRLFFNEDVSVLYRDGNEMKGNKEIEEVIKEAITVCLPEAMSSEQKRKIVNGKFYHVIEPSIKILQEARFADKKSDHYQTNVDAADKDLVCTVKKELKNTLLHKPAIKIKPKNKIKSATPASKADTVENKPTAKELSDLLSDALGD